MKEHNWWPVHDPRLMENYFRNVNEHRAHRHGRQPAISCRHLSVSRVYRRSLAYKPRLCSGGKLHVASVAFHVAPKQAEPNGAVALYGAACRCSQGVALFLSFSPRTVRPPVSGKHRYGRRDIATLERKKGTFNSLPTPLSQSEVSDSFKALS